MRSTEFKLRNTFLMHAYFIKNKVIHLKYIHWRNNRNKVEFGYKKVKSIVNRMRISENF